MKIAKVIDFTNTSQIAKFHPLPISTKIYLF